MDILAQVPTILQGGSLGVGVLHLEVTPGLIVGSRCPRPHQHLHCARCGAGTRFTGMWIP